MCTSGAANTCSAVVGVCAGRSANPAVSAPSPMINAAAAANSVVRQPNRFRAGRTAESSAVTNLGRRLDRGRGGHHRQRLADRAHLVVERPGHRGWALRQSVLDVGAFVVADGVECVRRRQFQQLEVGWLGHVTPKQFRSARSASRIRDLMVARLADSCCDTCEYVSPP